METKQKKSYAQYAWVLLPIVHFGLSFWYERKILKFDATSWDIFWSVSMDDKIGNRAQSFLLYGFGKLVAGILIFLLWYAVYSLTKAVIQKKIPIYIPGMLAFILVVLGAYYMLFWPSSFSWQDSYTLYGFSVRLIPWYWHHFLTSAWYVGCLMVFPHPIVLSAIQYVGFAAVVLYLYYRIEKSFKPPLWAKLLIFLVYVAPETFMLVTQVYRNCIYAIILMFYISFLVLEDVDKAQCDAKKIVLICGLSALLSVWRTEGIFVGLVGIILCVTRIYKLPVLKKIFILLGFGVFFIVLNAPQKIGDSKYYGKDYIIISTIEPVKNILNDPNVNIAYKGADDDLEAIAAYAPLELIRQDGIEGVRGYFYEQGHVDFNQSLLDEDIQGKYLKAFIRLGIHNLGPYIKSQMNFMLEAIGIDYSYKMGEYDGEYPETHYEYTVDRIGELDYVSARGVQKLVKNETYLKLLGNVAVVTVNYRNFIKKFYITAVLRIIILLADIAVALIELVKLLRKKNGNITYMLFAFLFLAQFILVTMTIPAAYSLYYYSIFYPCLVLVVIYAFDRLRKKH